MNAMKSHPSRAWPRFSGVLALFLAAAPAARAQVPGMVAAPQDIATCLCLERSVSALDADLAARSRAYQAKRQEVEALDLEVAQARQRVNVANSAEIDAFKSLLDRRNAAQTELAQRLTPDYARLVETYNRRVGDYNAQCAGRIYEPQALAQVRAALSCSTP
jgi:hypothetical protein